MARFWFEGKRRSDALKLLSSEFEKFSEGFETFDLKSARDLLTQLGYRSAKKGFPDQAIQAATQSHILLDWRPSRNILNN